MKRLFVLGLLCLSLAFAQEVVGAEEKLEEEKNNKNPYDHVVAVKFALNGEQNEEGEFYEKINQIEALYWQDPAWESYTPSWGEKGSVISVSIISDPDVTYLHAGLPAVYKMRYDVTYRKNPRLPGTEGFVVNGGDLVEAGSPSRDVARRTVEVTPINWAKCLNEPFDESVRDCRFVQYLNKVPCHQFSPKYHAECLDFGEWSGIIPEDAGPVPSIERSTSEIVQETTGKNNQPTGRFYVQCLGQEPIHSSDRRLYGLFHFPKEGNTYEPLCSPCQRRNVCSQHSVCKDLGKGKFECLCIPGYDKDPYGNCQRNHTHPEILLRFKNKHQSITKLKQCGRYIEEGYDVVVGNNPDPSHRNSYVDVEYPPELQLQLIRHHGEFEVAYWLRGTPAGRDPPPPVMRRVIVEQVDRCGLKHCGEPCPENTVCQHQRGKKFPEDIACACYQPRQCSNPADLVDEPLPAFYSERTNSSRAFHKQKVAEGYNWHLPSTRCYDEQGERERTICRDAAPPVMYYKEYDHPMYTCRVCHKSLTEGAFEEPDCFSYDFHDGVGKKCDFIRKDIKKLNDTHSVEAVQLVAKDYAGHENTITIELLHQIQDISEEIDELILFRKQMNDFKEAIGTFFYWAQLILVAITVILLCWLAFTQEGMLFFLTLCAKGKQPGVPWHVHHANIEAQMIYHHRNEQKN